MGVACLLDGHGLLGRLLAGHGPMVAVWPDGLGRAGGSGSPERLRIPGAAASRVEGLAAGPAPDGDPLAHERGLQRGTHPGDVRRRARLLELGLRTLAGLDRPLLVDLVGMLGEVGHDDHLVGAHLDEAARDEEDLLGAALLDPQLPGAQRTDQSRVVRQDAQLAIDAGHDHHVDLVGERPPLRTDDLQLQRHLRYLLTDARGEDAQGRGRGRRGRHRRVLQRQPRCRSGRPSAPSVYLMLSAFSTTSSIWPAIRKACSGSWSCFPSRISRAPRTVSLRSTYFPGRPVNCSATNMGWLMYRWSRRARATVTLSSSE